MHRHYRSLTPSVSSVMISVATEAITSCSERLSFYSDSVRYGSEDRQLLK